MFMQELYNIYIFYVALLSIITLYYCVFLAYCNCYKFFVTLETCNMIIIIENRKIFTNFKKFLKLFLIFIELLPLKIIS